MQVRLLGKDMLVKFSIVNEILSKSVYHRRWGTVNKQFAKWIDKLPYDSYTI